jgi:hypothetical protein
MRLVYIQMCVTSVVGIVNLQLFVCTGAAVLLSLPHHTNLVLG